VEIKKDSDRSSEKVNQHEEKLGGGREKASRMGKENQLTIYAKRT